MFGLPTFQNGKLFDAYTPLIRSDEGEIVESYLQNLDAFYSQNHTQIGRAHV